MVYELVRTIYTYSIIIVHRRCSFIDDNKQWIVCAAKNLYYCFCIWSKHERDQNIYAWKSYALMKNLSLEHILWERSSDSKSRIDAARLTRHSNSRRWIRMVNKGQMSFAATSLPLLDPYFVNTFAVPRCDKIALCRQLRIRTESWWRSPWRCNMKGKISLKSM